MNKVSLKKYLVTACISIAVVVVSYYYNSLRGDALSGPVNTLMMLSLVVFIVSIVALLVNFFINLFRNK